MSNKVDFGKLRQEIEGKKKEIGVAVEPKDKFLHQMLSSLDGGRVNESVKRVKVITDLANVKKGEKPIFHGDDNTLRENVGNIENSKHRTNQINGDYREEMMYGDAFNKMRKNVNNTEIPGTLLEELEKFQNKNGSLNQIARERNNDSKVINEEFIKEEFNKILLENYQMLFEDSLNSKIIEMFAIDRIKNVLFENKALLRAVVIDVIRDLKNEKSNK